MAELPTNLDEMRALLESLLKIKVVEALESDFAATPKLRAVFQMTGKATRSEIKMKVKIGTQVIDRAWASWHGRGLIRKVGQRYEKLWRD